MKIVDKRKERTVDFKDLDFGTVFYMPDEQWYGMKLADTTNLGKNAVDLSDGHLACMDDLDQVTELNTHLVILN